MYRLSFVLTLVLAALPVAAADTDREDSHVIFGSVVVMREMVSAEALGGYRAFHLAVIRSQEEQPTHMLGEGRYFGSADGQTTYEEALARWTPLARNGDPEATSNLGVLYDLGLGVVPDQARAVRLYRRAAEQGFVPAWNNLGVAYALGRGVARDDAQAVAWLRKAAKHGLARDQWADANNVDGLRKASERGFALAQNTLGVMYLDGRWGVRDDATGSRWVAVAFMRPGEGIFDAANRNAIRFMSADDYLKGLQYAEGRGVPKDPLEAHKWFDIADEKGHPDAAQQKAALTEAVDRANMERWAAVVLFGP